MISFYMENKLQRPKYLKNTNKILASSASKNSRILNQKMLYQCFSKALYTAMLEANPEHNTKFPTRNIALFNSDTPIKYSVPNELYKFN